MRTRQYTFSCKEVTRCTVTTLVEALGWSASLTRLGPERLVQLLVRAAAAMRSLSAIVQEAQAVPSWETVRQALLKYLPAQANELLPATTQALHRRLPKGLRRRPRTMAIDWHLRPFYGSPRTPGVYRGKPKAGTKYFFAYASLLIIRRGQSFTVGLTPVAQGEKQTTVIARLLEQAQQAGLRVRRLLLDRGFYGAATIHWLQEHELAFVMPMLQRGKPGRSKATSTGTQKFFVRGRRGWATYTWTTPRRRGRRQAEKITVTVDVCMAPRPKGRGRKKGPLVYACYRLPQMSPDAVRQLYRQRFGIETSYRQLGEGLAASCSRNRVYRFLLVAIALVLRNLWVWLHWRFLAERTQRGRKLRLQRLTLRKLTYWILRRLDHLLNISPCAITTGGQAINDG
jgi:DDE family transposase